MNKIELKTFFNKKLENINVLEESIIEKINNLTNIVCAPEYNKTPEFIVEKYKKKFKNKNENTIDNFNFNITVIKKNIGIEKEIDNIRILLNKLTESSFNNILRDIQDILNKIISNFYENVFEKVGISMYNIFISNILFSKIYSKLIIKLNNSNFLNDIINNKLISFHIFFEEEMVKNNEHCLSFDEISNNNKKSDLKKGEAQLLTNLLLENFIKKEDFINFLEKLMNLFYEIINKEDKISLIDKLADIIFIIIKDSFNYLKKENYYTEIESFINDISNMKIKSRPSISNKAIFKFMDLRDLLLIFGNKK